ncbi:MAG: DUF2069 domain-containing protein [Gammaproteobacteria bacterium]|nr:DUF2069 domain-containing protein [Gammaproteobacteria bacterium]
MILPSSRFLYTLILAGHLGTLALLVAWYSWLAPSKHFPVSLVLLVLVLPLFAPLRGLLHRRRYTIAWSCFLALLYFTHGVVEAYVSDAARHLALLEVVFSSLWFLAAMAYVRVTAAQS